MPEPNPLPNSAETAGNELPEARRRLPLRSALVFAAVVAVLVLYPYYTTYVAPWRVPVIAVRDAVFDMRYLVKLLRLYAPGGAADSSAPAQMLVAIQNSELVRQEAERRGLRIAPEKIEAAVKRRVSEGDEGDFAGRYRALLARTGFSEAEFRRLVEGELCREALLGDFGREVPSSAEQVHVYGILLESSDKAEEVRRRLLGGEDFGKLAAEHSLEGASKALGGDLGWWPRGLHASVAAPQVRVFGILTKTREQAAAARQRVERGEPFAALAREVSQDRRSADKGGDLGWIAKGMLERPLEVAVFALDADRLTEPVEVPEGYWIARVVERAPAGHLIDDIAFGLPEGELTPPLATSEGYYLIRVAERAAGRELAPNQREALQAKAMERWIEAASRQGAAEGWIKWFWDSDRYAWAVEHAR